MTKTKYLGKTITINSIKKKYELNDKEIKNIETNKTRYILNEKTGDVMKLKLQEPNSLLLLKEFGVKRPNNKNLITGSQQYIKKDIKVFNTGISTNKKLTGTIKVVFFCENISSGNSFTPIIIKRIEKEIFNTDDILEELTNKLYLQFPMLRARDWVVSVQSYDFVSRNNVVLAIDEMKLRDDKPLDISNIYGENVQLIKNNENCVKEYLKTNYPKINSDKIGNEEGVTSNELYDFCVKYRITMKLYNIEGEAVKTYTPEKRNKSYKKMIAIVYNNHIYPLKNNYLHKNNIKTIKNIVKVDNVRDELINKLKDGIYPDNANVYHDTKEKKDIITAFQINETVYHNNHDYKSIQNIFKSYGIEENLFYTDNLVNVCDKIEKLFVKSNINSYFPYNSNIGGFNFVNDEFDDEYITTDQNGHYAQALRQLKYLITIDYKTAKYIEKPKELLPDYYYNVKISHSTILMPQSGLYSYDELIYCMEQGIKFKVIEAIECKQTENYFKNMIDDIEKKYKNGLIKKEEMKSIYCSLIGKFENQEAPRTVYKFKKIANNDETKTSDGHIININKNYNIIYDIEEPSNIKITNRVPIRRQVIFEARKIIYEKMKELKLKPNEIKQIKTDAITFKKKQIKTGSNIGDWKIEDKTKFLNSCDVIDLDFSLKLKPINKNNTLYIDYAGSGKTHYIINKLIPKLKNYIVLSPSHASIREYRKNKINCSVVQKYLYCELPKEDNIIVDEIGMLDTESNNMLLKCALLGKNIYSFGDYKQLKPVNSEICNGQLFLNHLYNKISSLGTNHRNNFTKEYYDELINMTDNNEIKKEILKHNTQKAYNAETIICYRNNTRNKYNELMAQHLNIKFGDIGCKIVCTSNDLRDKDIYNNFYYKVISNDDKIIISDDVEEKEITPEELDKYFDFGYCRTLYNIQGESIKSFHFCLEDVDLIDGRALYTLISRLKQDKIKKEKEETDKFNLDDD